MLPSSRSDWFSRVSLTSGFAQGRQKGVSRWEGTEGMKSGERTGRDTGKKHKTWVCRDLRERWLKLRLPEPSQ